MATVVSDDIPGGLFIENLSKDGDWVYSKSEKRRLMAEKGVEEYVQHQPLQGSDKSPHTTRWI